MSTGRRQYQRNYFKRKAILQRKIAMISITFLALLFALGLVNRFATSHIYAQEVSYQKYYKSISISEGDSLWSIAASNLEAMEEVPVDLDMKAYIKEIIHTNQLSSNTLFAGQTLSIPYYDVANK